MGSPEKPYLTELYDAIEPGYYDRVFRRGRGPQWFWHEHRFRMVIDLLPPHLGKVLDLGCGPGTFLGHLPEGSFAQAVGVDLAEEQIDYARRTYGRPGLDFRVADARDFIGSDRAERFDTLVSIEVIEHLPRGETAAFLRTIHQLLEPGGVVVLTTPNYRSHWPVIEWLLGRLGPVDYGPQHINPFDRKRLETELAAAGFEVTASRTFFGIAPFLAAISTRLARTWMSAEGILLPSWGAELVVRGRKPAVAKAHPHEMPRPEEDLARA